MLRCCELLALLQGTQETVIPYTHLWSRAIDTQVAPADGSKVFHKHETHINKSWLNGATGWPRSGYQDTEYGALLWVNASRYECFCRCLNVPTV